MVSIGCKGELLGRIDDKPNALRPAATAGAADWQSQFSFFFVGGCMVSTALLRGWSV
jgi:hypothetical protein